MTNRLKTSLSGRSSKPLCFKHGGRGGHAGTSERALNPAHQNHGENSSKHRAVGRNFSAREKLGATSMARTLPTCGIPEDFQLTEKTVARIEQRDFSIDIPQTLEKFILNAEAKGWMYKNWQAAFINYCDNGKQYGGVFYKAGRAADPKWVPVLNEAKPFGFRDPESHETPASYRTSFENWRRFEGKHATAQNFAANLRAVK